MPTDQSRIDGMTSEYSSKRLESFWPVLVFDCKGGIDEPMDRLDPGGRPSSRLVVADHARGDAHVVREVRLRDPQLLPPLPHRLPRLLRQRDLAGNFLSERELHGASENGNDI